MGKIPTLKSSMLLCLKRILTEDQILIHQKVYDSARTGFPKKGALEGQREEDPLETVR